MTSASTTTPQKASAGGRAYLWLGIALPLLGIAIYVAQLSLKNLTVPWYVAVMGTIGVLLLIAAVARRRSVARIVALALVAALAGYEWYWLFSFTKLPEYAGPARAGQPIPAFQTTLADGRPFTEKDLQSGTFSAIVFFRGRW